MSNIAYLRVSHTESLNGTSLEVQESKCRAFGELHGFKIDKVYSEVTSGGVEFRKRPIFQKILNELKLTNVCCRRVMLTHVDVE